jgi:hypothetical protein
MRRIREHKARAASRGGESDEDTIEAYAEIMDGMQFHKDRIKHLREKDKDSTK